MLLKVSQCFLFFFSFCVSFLACCRLQRVRRLSCVAGGFGGLLNVQLRVSLFSWLPQRDAYSTKPLLQLPVPPFLSSHLNWKALSFQF